VDLLLTLPHVERPGVFEGFILLAGFEEGHLAGLSDEESNEIRSADGKRDNCECPAHGS